MKYVDEFRDPAVISGVAREIARTVDPARHYRIMEVCGGHTHSIYRHGLRDVLPENIELVHGPDAPYACCPTGPRRRRLVDCGARERGSRVLRRHDARARHAGNAARTQSAGRGHSHGLLAARRTAHRRTEPGQTRLLLCDRLRDDRPIDRADDPARCKLSASRTSRSSATT